uniref:Nucleotid_trans domain-containing protein n=1 Tax=Angiostrongylus cantonensis TaxID=6313 RepID=A0A0K0DD08_ANGCA
MGDTGLKLMEQFGEDEKVLQWMLKPWFKASFLLYSLSSNHFLVFFIDADVLIFLYQRFG